MLLLVRHGETAPNVEGRLLGRADPPLTPLGERQAAMLAESLPRPDLVIASPLRRAHATAAAFGVAVEIDERWIELDYGSLDGTPIESLDPAAWDRWRSDVGYSPGGGETLAALGERVRAACTELATLANDHVVLVVTHVSPVKAALAWALGVGDEIAWRLFVEDAGVARVDFGSHGPVVRWFNRGVISRS
jgi:broad specificity phosphatase PhoE